MAGEGNEDPFIRNIIPVIRLGRRIPWGDAVNGDNLEQLNFGVGFVTLVAVVSAAKSKYGEPPFGREVDARDPVWWVLGAATGVSIVAMWMSVWMRMRLMAPRYRAAGYTVLALAVAALASVVHVGNLKLKQLFELMTAVL